MRVNAYILFDGKTEEALNFYQSALGGNITAMNKVAGSPAEEHMPPEMKNGVLHGALSLDNMDIFASDCGSPEEVAQRSRLCVNLEDAGKAESVFNALSKGGTVTMPLGETFFARKYGQLTDKFGTHWMVVCE
jgi:PhnB protein